ncbi:MAG: acyltransferase [Gracilimonas sp.]|nr:acyltransferase [Gracilimonas sp.]
MVHDTDFHIPGKAFTKAQGIPIVIEEGAWLSSRVIVLKGSVIGKGSVIAAGSVVSGIIPPNVIAGGVPAKVIKKIDPNSSEAGQNKSKKTGIDCRVKNKVDSIIKSVTGTDAYELPQNTPVSSIKNWTAENHLLILKSIENEFLFESNESSYLKLSSLQKIYQWVSSCASGPIKKPHIISE